MIFVLSVFSLAIVFAILVALAVIDVKHYILPDGLNISLALFFVAFHILTRWEYVAPLDAVLGAAAGGVFLLVIRFAAEKFYGEDALGLGDVKLMTAAGVGLGFPDILMALSLGAGLGLVHGLWMGLSRRRAGEAVDLGRVNVPAGLGLCAGIAILAGVKFIPELVR